MLVQVPKYASDLDCEQKQEHWVVFHGRVTAGIHCSTSERKKTQTIDYLVSMWQALRYSGGLKQPPWTSNNKHSAMEATCHYWTLVCVEIVKMTPSVINYSSLGHCAQAPCMVVILWSIGIIITSRILSIGKNLPLFLFFDPMLLMNAVPSAWFALQLHTSQFLISFVSNPMYFPWKHLDLVSQLLHKNKPIASVSSRG